MVKFFRDHWIAFLLACIAHGFLFLFFFIFSEPLRDVELNTKRGKKVSIVQAYSFDESIYQKEIAKLSEYEIQKAEKKRTTELKYKRKIQNLNNEQLKIQKLYKNLKQKVQSQEKTLKIKNSEIIKVKEQQKVQKTALQNQVKLLENKKQELQKQKQKQIILERSLKEKQKLAQEKDALLQKQKQKQIILERSLKEKQKLAQEKDALLQKQKQQEEQIAREITKKTADIRSKQKAQKAIEARLSRKKKLLKEQQLIYRNVQNSLSAERKKQLEAIRLNYVLIISAQVRSMWRQPVSTQANWYCQLLVTQNEVGIVIDIQVKSCNTSDQTFVQSVERAIWAASPLPLPEVKEVFDRQILFNFKARE